MVEWKIQAVQAVYASPLPIYEDNDWIIKASLDDDPEILHCCRINTGDLEGAALKEALDGQVEEMKEFLRNRK